jgi:hypothetical protein
MPTTAPNEQNKNNHKQKESFTQQKTPTAHNKPEVDV